MSIPFDYEACQHVPEYYPPKPYGPAKNNPACKSKCEPQPVVSNCKNIFGAANIPIINISAAALVPKALGTISAEVYCFNKPSVKLDLSALIVIGAATDVPFTITFRVLKRCDNQPEIEINSFDFPVIGPVAVGTSMPINFGVCDCDNCPACCCTYRVIVQGTALAAITSFFSINQGVLSILAFDQC